MNCNVYHDLILLYLSGECGEDTNKLVKEHMEQCEECRKYYERLASPLPEEGTEEGAAEGTAEAKQAVELVKKVSRRLKKKWVYSLIAGVTAFFMIAGAVVLCVNQVRGSGLCFTSADDRYYAKTFLRAVQKGDYDKAFSLLDVERMYAQITERNMVPENIGAYREAEIGNQQWYLREEIWLNEYQDYLEDQDQATFWSRIMAADDKVYTPAAIPEEQYEAAAEKLRQTADERTSNGSKEETGKMGDSYDKTVLPSGEAFYRRSGWDINVVTFYEPCIPADIYEENRDMALEQNEIVESCVSYYEDMGYETYKELVREKFLAQMEEMEQQGLKIRGLQIKDSYRMYNSDGMEAWQVEAAVRTTGEEGRKLILTVCGGTLRVIGSVGPEGGADELLEYMYVTADPAGFYEKAYGSVKGTP